MLKFLLSLSLIALVFGDAEEDCLNKCNSELVNSARDSCQPWRAVLPRPQLYNSCLHGYREGGQIACADECLGDLKPSYEAVATTACDKYKIVLPREILSSCKKGFLDAVVKANSVAGKKGSPNLAAEVEARRLQESKAAKAALEKRRLAEEKLKIDKKIKEDAAKLEQARKDAATAYISEKENEL